MYDMSVLKTRYFKLKLKNGLVLEVEPPTIKSLKKIMKLGSVKPEECSDEEFGGLAEGLAIALSKNRRSKEITTDFIEENFTIIEIQHLLIKYFEWVEGIKTEKN